MEKKKNGTTYISLQVFLEMNSRFLRLVEEPLDGTDGKIKNIVLTMSSPLKHWTKGTLGRMSVAGLFISQLLSAP